ASASTGCDAALWLRGSTRGGTMSAYRFYVGLDWATEAHRVVVQDAERQGVAERTVPHEGGALEAFAAWLSELAAGVPRDVAVALESPRGAVVDILLAKRLPCLCAQSQAARSLPRSLHRGRRQRRPARCHRARHRPSDRPARLPAARAGAPAGHRAAGALAARGRAAAGAPAPDQSTARATAP